MTTTEPARISSAEPTHLGAILELIERVQRLDLSLPTMIEAADGRLDDLLTMLADADDLIAGVRTIRSALERECAQQMEKNTYESWAAGVRATRNWTYDETWNHRAAARALAEAAIVDRKTGEVLTDPDKVREAVTDGFLTALSTNPNWRVTGMRQLDVDPDEYRTRVKKRRTVSVTRNGGPS